MPFDGTGLDERNRRLEQLGRIEKILGAEDRWCKGTLVSQDGRRCLLGAVIEANAETLKPAILMAIRQVTGRRYSRIEKFNDAHGTTYADLRAVIERTRHDISYGPSMETMRIRLWDRFRSWNWL